MVWNTRSSDKRQKTFIPLLEKSVNLTSFSLTGKISSTSSFNRDPLSVTYYLRKTLNLKAALLPSGRKPFSNRPISIWCKNTFSHPINRRRPRDVWINGIDMLGYRVKKLALRAIWGILKHHYRLEDAFKIGTLNRQGWTEGLSLKWE